MAQENEPKSELEAKLDRYKRFLDPGLDAMTLDNIRQLVREIEDQMAKRQSC